MFSVAVTLRCQRGIKEREGEGEGQGEGEIERGRGRERERDLYRAHSDGPRQEQTALSIITGIFRKH